MLLPTLGAHSCISLRPCELSRALRRSSKPPREEISWKLSAMPCTNKPPSPTASTRTVHDQHTGSSNGFIRIAINPLLRLQSSLKAMEHKSLIQPRRTRQMHTLFPARRTRQPRNASKLLGEAETDPAQDLFWLPLANRRRGRGGRGADKSRL